MQFFFQLLSNFFFADFIAFLYILPLLWYGCISVKIYPESSAFFNNLRGHKRSRGRFFLLMIKSLDSLFEFRKQLYPDPFSLTIKISRDNKNWHARWDTMNELIKRFEWWTEFYQSMHLRSGKITAPEMDQQTKNNDSKQVESSLGMHVSLMTSLVA